MTNTHSTKTAAVVTSTTGTLLQMGSGTVLTVGAGMEFATLGAACKAAASGDTIAVQAGTYVNDFAVVSTNLHIVAIGGMVNEVATTPPPNDKGLLTVDANLSIQGFSFTGGADNSPDGNVSGIRLEAGNLAVKYCYFHDMQEGLLAGADPTATVTIDHSEFAHNGTGDGYSHNLYVGAVASLTVTSSYFHDANVGHEIKSRAAVTTITNNVIADGPNGTASYDIDLPNAGVARIANNLIEKGQNASNFYAIHYGGETQYAYANNSLSITGNTILNDLGANGAAVLNQSNYNGLSVSASITGNRFWGFDTARLVLGAGTLQSNAILSAEPGYSTASPWTDVPMVGVSTGPALLNLTNSNNTITGGQARLTVQDTAGSNTITGGAGGVGVSAAAGWDLITTQAGAADALTLSGRNSVVHSYGLDHIAASGNYEEVDAFGAATITGSGFNAYNLNGAGEHLTTAGSGVVDVSAAGQALVTDLGGDLKLSVAAGGVVAVSDQAASSGGAPSSATVSGGGASGVIGNSGVISIVTFDAGAAVVAGTGSVVVTGGAGADTLTAGSGTDAFTLGGGADSVTFGSGTASVTGGAGADTYVFAQGAHGTVTIAGFKQGTDALQFNGFTGAAIASGTIEGGSTLLTLADGTTIDLTSVVLPGYSGTPMPPAGGGGGGSPAPTPPPTPAPTPAPPASGNGTIVLSNGGHAVAGGASALTVLDYAGGNTVAGGVGGLSASAAYGDSLSTQAGAVDQISLSRCDTLTGAGTDSVTVSGYANSLAFAGAATVVLAGAANAVHGGTGVLTVSDQIGGDTLVGGAGGILAALAGTYDNVTTAQGATDSVSLAGQATLLSQGTDQITLAGNYNQVTVTGAANITAGIGFSAYTLDGADSLSGAGGGVATVGGAANVTVASAGQQDLTITKLAGGTLAASESVGGGVSALTVCGGAATVSAAAGQYGGLRAIVGAGVTAAAGAGNVTLTGGAGGDRFVCGAGQALVTLGGQDTVCLGMGSVTVQGGVADVFVVPQGDTGTLVVMNWSAQDSIVTPGQGEPAIASQTVSGGSAWITMVGGAHIELVGVGHTI